jgi:hypothetical protein
MTPKEKANDLFNKYFSELRFPSDCEGCMQCVDRCGNMVAVAKKYSLIAVEEILTRMIGSRAYSFNEKLFWSEVKSELQSL